MQLKPELAEKLYTAFPHSDGWYQLLYDLSQELNNYQAKHPAIDLEVEQVKSKFGILRFHLSGGDAVTEKMIERACQRASVTCELTGQPGQHCVSPKRRFVMVLCPEKAAELGYVPVGNQNSRESKNAH